MKECHHSFRKERVNVHIKKYKINNEYTQHLAALVWPEWSSFWLKLFKSASGCSALWPCTQSTGPQEGGAGVELATSTFVFRQSAISSSSSLSMIFITDWNWFLPVHLFFCLWNASTRVEFDGTVWRMFNLTQEQNSNAGWWKRHRNWKRPGFAVGKVLSSSPRKRTHTNDT